MSSLLRFISSGVGFLFGIKEIFNCLLGVSF